MTEKIAGAAKSGIADISCPVEEQLAEFAYGSLPRETHERVAEHLDQCASCRRSVSGLAPALASAPGALSPDAPAFGPVRASTAIGRYVVLYPVGQGQMGHVYAAYDPELDRKVALKLLRSGHQQTARLAAEARALAKLSHPNVVAVHDVGQ